MQYRPEKRSRAYYIDLVRTHFPEVAFTSARIIRHGWDHDVLILDDTIVFRFPKQDGYENSFKAELKFLDYLEGKVNLFIPHYLYVNEQPLFGGYKIIPGEELLRSKYETLTSRQQKKAARDMGTFLSTIHATPVATAKRMGFKEEKSGHWLGQKNAQNIHTYMQKVLYPHLNEQETTWLDRQFTYYLSLRHPKRTKVCHGDFTDDHILVDSEKGTLTGVIDFADTEFSDPALDFAGLWRYGEKCVDEALQAYDHKIDPDFKDRTKFRYLVQRATNMLEILDGDPIPVSFTKSRQGLRKIMAEGVGY